MQTIESEWLAESQQAMRGWDFSHLKGRCQTEELPWNYSAWVRRHLKPSDEWLDMDTGGGELMQTFQHPVEKTTVTEGWQPNIDLLKRTLVPQGVTLYPDPEERLAQVPDEHFDIVTNSHGGLPIRDIARVLRPHGLFVSQQVGATNNYSLSRFLNANYVPAFPDLKSDAAFVKMNFTDVGAIVYYATVIPWEFPDFDVKKVMPQLHQLQKIIDSQGSVTTFEDRFIVLAKKN